MGVGVEVKCQPLPFAKDRGGSGYGDLYSKMETVLSNHSGWPGTEGILGCETLVAKVGKVPGNP